MSNVIAMKPEPISKELQEKALLNGDLGPLNTDQRLAYYRAVCESLGLNPLTKPFGYIQLNGKLVLYALKDCTEQLRGLHKVSITNLAVQSIEGVYVVTAKARRADGKEDVATGAVFTNGLKGNDLANALMKAETKAKRRVTLSICGLGMLDETEAETVPGAVLAVPEIKPEQPQKPTPLVIPNTDVIPGPDKLKTQVQQAEPTIPDPDPNSVYPMSVLADSMECDAIVANVLDIKQKKTKTGKDAADYLLVDNVTKKTVTVSKFGVPNMQVGDFVKVSVLKAKMYGEKKFWSAWKIERIAE